MTQIRSHSVFEAVSNVVVGYGVNYTANMLIFPLFGWSISHSQNLALGILYTAISLVRSYALRRIWNRVGSTAKTISPGELGISLPQPEPKETKQ